MNRCVASIRIAGLLIAIHVRRFALAALAACAIVLLISSATSAFAAPAAGIPVAVEFGKKQGDLSPSEVTFIANHVQVAAIEHFGGRDAPYPFREDGVVANAARLKAANPKIKVLEYWGFSGAGHTNFRAYEDPQFKANSAAWYTQRPGKKKSRLDLTNPAVRAWWAGAAAKMVANGKLDGLFIDGAGNKPGDLWHDAKIELFKELRRDLDTLGGHKLVVINGNAANLVGSGLAPYVDGVMIEWFDLVYYPKGAAQGNPRTPQQNLDYLRAAYAVAASGKQVWLKAWPYPQNFLNREWNTGRKYEQKVADMRAPLAWYIAAHLVSAVPGSSFLSYSYGYSVDSLEVVKNHDADPKSWQVDDAWYSELRNNYGEPLGPMQVDGYVVTRRYHTGTVRLDLSNHTAALPPPLK